MRSLFSGITKLIFGSFLFGLVLLANPIEVNADGFNSLPIIDATSVTTPSFVRFNGSSLNLNDDAPINQYGLVPFSSFDVDIDFSFIFTSNGSSFASLCDMPFNCKAYALFTIPDGGAYQQLLGSIALSPDLLNIGGSVSDSFMFTFHCDIPGVPTGIRLVLDSAQVHFSSFDLSLTAGNGSFDRVDTFTSYLYCYFRSSFKNFSFDQSSSGNGSSTVINNVNSNLTPIGYSSLNFGVNGNCYFLEDNYIFKPDYISPLMFLYDFANSVTGTVGSSSLTFCMGDIASVSPVRGNPIAVIGDTRQGEYELTLGFCLGSSPTSSELASLINLSNWGFEFNRGYSGDQFPMPSNVRVSYTNFLDTSKNLYYVNVYFYFTTPDYFDSFMIRKAPILRNIRVGAFAFNKYTGTISDQLTQSSQQWDYQIPSHNSFSSANSSAASTVSAFSSIEADAFSNLDTAMSGAGVNDFNINVISTPLATVSSMINQTYNILPDLVKWLILAILVIGIFAVIISANNYVNKD